MKALLSLFIASLLAFVAFAGFRIVNAVVFERECGGYLQRAANANTVQLAERELAHAVAYLETNHLTTGYTSILYRTPDEDIGYWYDNLKASLTELRSLKPDITPLEQSNVLLKLRETLTDNGQGGTKVTAPEGISVYPHNGVFALIGWVSFLAVCRFGVAVISDL